jgi:putative membrane protein
MKLRKYILAILLLAYAILWFGGVGSYVFFKQPPPEATWAAPLFLLLAGLIIVISSDKKSAFSLSLAGLIGLTSEIIGIHTGYPFGRYQYTDVIKPTFFTVPLVMITAWIILPAYIRQIMIQVKLKRTALIVLSAAVMAFIDLLIDPVAIGSMKFWMWIDLGPYYGIPFINFFGWFFVSLIIFSFLLKSSVKNTWHRYMGTSVILFFTIIALADSLILAGFSGILILIIQGIIDYQLWKNIQLSHID